MSLIEIIGFIVSFLALMMIGFKSKEDARRRQEHPEEFEEEKFLEDDSDEPIDHLLNAVKRKPKVIAPPPPKPKKIAQPLPAYKSFPQETFSAVEQRKLQSQIQQRKLKSKIESHRLESKIEGRHLQPQLNKKSDYFEEKVKNKTSKGLRMIESLPDLKDMIVYQTIIGKPKGLEDGF